MLIFFPGDILVGPATENDGAEEGTWCRAEAAWKSGVRHTRLLVSSEGNKCIRYSVPSCARWKGVCILIGENKIPPGWVARSLTIFASAARTSQRETQKLREETGPCVFDGAGKWEGTKASGCWNCCRTTYRQTSFTPGSRRSGRVQFPQHLINVKIK